MTTTARDTSLANFRACEDVAILLLSKENPVIDQQATKLSVYLQAVLSQQH
jgi:hypothetical protein